jgi:hypothetical protein
MHRFVRNLIISWIIVFIMAVVVPTFAQDAPPIDQEGIEVQYLVGNRFAVIRWTIYAIKQDDGTSRHTRVRVFYEADGDCGFTSRIDTTIALPDDPDELEVSNDLGWGGLNGMAQVQILIRTYAETNAGPCDYTETFLTVPVEFHLNLLANQPAHDNGTHHTRTADISGTVQIAGGNWTFPLHPNPYESSSGQTFSTRAPFPD